MPLETLPEPFGYEVKQLAWRSAWMASNEAVGYIEDATKDKEAVAQHFAAAQALAVLSDSVLTDIRTLCYDAAWHTAYTRIACNSDAAARAKTQFEAHAAAVAGSGEVTVWLAGEVQWMSWNASWHAANSRIGYDADAKSDYAAFETCYRRAVGRSYRGVSLGGWLLLERWQCTAMFADYPESSAPDEYSLCSLMGRDKAAAKIEEWRSSWITKDDFARIKELNFNCVRVPFGFWVLDEVQGAGIDTGPFVPGGMHIDHAVQWAQEYGLKVVLDLHGVPGFQSGHHATGRQNPDWRPSDWNVNNTLKVISLIVERYKHSPSVCGLGVINEPDNTIPAEQLVAFYRAAYGIIRDAGMRADTVDVFCPIYQRDPLQFGQLGFPDPSMQCAILEIHSYQCFGTSWTSLTLANHLARAADGRGHWPGLVDVVSVGELGVIGEWSLRLPDWDPSFGMYQEWSNMSEVQRDAALKQFAQSQIGQYGLSVGWFFWNWKVDANEPWWSAEECLTRGWIDKSWISPEGCSPVMSCQAWKQKSILSSAYSWKGCEIS